MNRAVPRLQLDTLIATVLRPLLLGALALLLGFVLLDSFPGVENGLVGRNADAATRAAARLTLGLDQPLWQRLLRWLGAAAHGDLGRSWLNGEPVSRLLAERLPVSIVLLLPGFLLGQLLALWAASRPSGNRLAQLAASLSMASGVVVLAILAQAVLARIFGLPIRGLPWAPWSALLLHLLLPTLVLALAGFGFSYLHFRSRFQQSRGAAFALAALARGEPGGANRAALREMSGLVLTRLLFALPVALLSSMVVESLFGVPGLGSRLAPSLLAGDQPVVLAIVLLFGLLYAVLRAVLNLLLIWADPRLLHA